MLLSGVNFSQMCLYFSLSLWGTGCTDSRGGRDGIWIEGSGVSQVTSRGMSTIYVLTSINLRCLQCRRCRHYTYISISFEMLDWKALQVLSDNCTLLQNLIIIDVGIYFCSPELKAQVNFSDHILSVVCSSVCLSVCQLFSFSSPSPRAYFKQT